MADGSIVNSPVLKCLPRFQGFYSVLVSRQDGSKGNESAFKWTHAIILHPIPRSYQPLHVLREASLELWNPSVNLFRAACSALRMLHELGYLHGDISRGNFLLTLEDVPETHRVFIVDFERTR